MPSPRLSCLTLLLTLVCLTPSASADDLGTLLFEDQFERTESQEETDEVGNGWSTNSKSRAKGNKQVDLRDGAMHIVCHPEADHAVSVVHPIGEEQGRTKGGPGYDDVAVELRFKLENPQDSLKLNFADLKYKKVHAGHLCAVTINPRQIQIADLKTGVMDLETRTKRKAGEKLSAARTKELKTKQKTFKRKTAVGEWHTVQVMITGDEMAVVIDGKPAGAFASEGIAHPTKRTLRLGVAKEAVVDDVRIFASE